MSGNAESSSKSAGQPPPGSRARRSALARLPRIRLGIASRLIISFIAVALLATGANLITVEGASITRTTRFQPVMRNSPAPLVAATPAPRPYTSRTASVFAPRSEPVSADVLRDATSAFDRATRDRAAGDSAQTQIAFDTALRSVEEASANYFAAIRGAGGQQAARLSPALNGYTLAASEIIRLADARRATLSGFTLRLDSMKTRVQAAVDNAWKILGRVVTSQSLIQLNVSLDEVRKEAVILGAWDSYDATGVAALQASEQHLSDLLEKNAKGLTRGNGGEWLAQMRADHVQLLVLQDSLLQLDVQRRNSQQQFGEARTALAALLALKIWVPVAGRTAAGATDAPLNGMATDGLSFVDSLQSASEPTLEFPGGAPRGAIEIQTIGGPPQESQRALLAWLTAAVMVILVFVSYRTVRSIVLPVRALLRATEDLAQHRKPARVARGGIKELDTLAVAFNRMADQLVAARALASEHQHELEAKVESRTRQLQDLARHDPLTGLPNRRQLFTLLDAALDKAARDKRYVGVLFVDIDNFKTINDSMGHAFGDRVLVSIAERLSEASRGFGFAARLGGDEFTIVHEGASGIEEIRLAGLQIVAAFGEPLQIGERSLHVSLSVGVSVYPDHERDAEALLRAADAALFRAKALGRSQLNLFTPDLLRLAAERFTTEQGLRRALEQNEFELMFQPELSVESMDTRLVEALIRWRLPDGRLLLPDEFLAVAEESGLILEVSDWVLRSAVESAAGWYHGPWPQARVAVNISPRQMLDPHFIAKLLALLDEFNLPGHCIEVELTESVLQTGAQTIATLHRLKDHGICIALDDFGTGYSSLSSLEQLPLSRIKLDRSLIESIDTNPRSAAIARAIIALCQSLGLEVTAEGIERPEQFAMLLGLRGVYLQGFLLSAPVPVGDVMRANGSAAERAGDLLLSSGALQSGAQVVPLLRSVRESSSGSAAGGQP